MPTNIKIKNIPEGYETIINNCKHTIIGDEPIISKGTDLGFATTDLILAGIAMCKVAMKFFFNSIYFDNDIRKSEQLKETFDKLKLIKNPVLYWFEIDETKIKADKIRSRYVDHLAKKSNRAMSSYKKIFDQNSKTLYVGKVKTGFWGG